jgi:RNA polymerase sigma-70 factor (ECF subfamily)
MSADRTNTVRMTRPAHLRLAAAEDAPTGEAVLEFREVFETEFSYVCRVLRRLGVRDADLDDVAQEVFLAVHKHYRERDPARPLRPWLVGFAYRFAVNYGRLARHRVKSGIDGGLLAPDRSPEQATSDREAQELLLVALQSVPIERRVVVVMHDVDGFLPREVAAALGIPVNTVYSRLRVARAELLAAVLARTELDT